MKMVFHSSWESHDHNNTFSSTDGTNEVATLSLFIAQLKKSLAAKFAGTSDGKKGLYLKKETINFKKVY